MQLEAESRLFTAVLLGTFLVSLGLGAVALARLAGGHPLLRFAPRRPVPWGPLGLVVCCLLIGLQITAWLMVPAGEGSQPTGDEFVQAAAENMLILAAVLAVGLLWVVGVHKATAVDLGLAWRPSRVVKDLVLGLLACGLALAPVYAIQLALVLIFKWEPSHDLFDALENPESTSVILISVAAAVIAAPLFEEVYFRLFLQGWLERIEMEACGLGRTRHSVDAISREPVHDTRLTNGADRDERLSDPRANPPPASTWPAREGLPGSSAEDVRSAEPTVVNPFESPDTQYPPKEVFPSDRQPGYEQAELPARGMLGLPFGWFPILVSSALFAVAHIGQGPSPIPLFFLALILGYLYQRTHRVLPCIAMHFAFNAYSLILLWLQGGPA